MADTTLPALLDTGTHAARPAATAVGSGALYSCTDHSLVYQSDGSTWTTWATLGGSGDVATDAIWDAAGDLAVGSGADTAARLAIGTAGQVLTVNAGATAPEWAAAAGGSGDGYDAGYDPRRPPSSGLNAVTDEFDDSSLDGDWTWTTTPAATVSESVYPGWLNLDGGTDASSTEHILRRAFAPGSAALSVAARVRFGMANGNYSGAIGVGLLDTSDVVIAGLRMYSDGTSTGSKAHRIFYGTGAGAAGVASGGAMGEQDMWFLITKADSSTTYTFYFSGNGLNWQFISNSTSGTSVQKVGILYLADTDSAPEGSVDFVRVFDSVTRKIGAVAA